MWALAIYAPSSFSSGFEFEPCRCRGISEAKEREREPLYQPPSQKEKRLTRDLLGRKTRAREPKPEDEKDQGTQTTELS
jgi:hypothetical protein